MLSCYMYVSFSDSIEMPECGLTGLNTDVVELPQTPEGDHRSARAVRGRRMS